MKKIICVFALIISSHFTVNAQMSEAGSFGAGLAWTSLNYGASLKYNFTETHTGQLIVGSANYGFSFSGQSSLSITGRYAYNFTSGDLDFAEYQPYVYGQVGYWTYKYDFFGGSFNQNSIAIGAGGGIEWTFNDFIEGLAFSFELGYTNISFDGVGSIGGFNGGGGIHYYF
ncbi:MULTISPECIES: hypothetical protein [Hyunsoonleella]|uniref:Outer membrane protein beta-barrel domain-containing protein n=1 Tax=Hyunsoonleella pacifica TaxID=1080224 RepID=A0A4Q9FNF8_9FLAO|nr:MULTISPECIES: hypothetical protein [Hyunsoonleella]TBN16316.1 hypothetical protein EYD46_06620 [Hyunsoonleella pacifica]GGD20492.1 hypothetical protein GCM10011368_23030 [Hyunsoonleella pacifica]